MDVEADRRVTPDRRGAPPQLSEEERIEAAQFLLSTRQREEAAVRGTHLRGDSSPQDEEHARKTLAEMLSLQKTARLAVPVAGHAQDVVALEAGARSTGFSRPLAWAVVVPLLLAAALVLVWRLW